MAQKLINVIALILFPIIYYIIKKLLKKRFFNIKNEEIIRFFF